jgi:hypothetical protein
MKCESKGCRYRQRWEVRVKTPEPAVLTIPLFVCGVHRRQLERRCRIASVSPTTREQSP